MIRPAYLDNPHALTTRSTTTHAARDACAIERHAQPWTLDDFAIAAIGVAALVLAAVGWLG